MKPSTHKKLVFAGFGCAGLLTLLMIVGLLLSGKFGLDENRPGARQYSPQEAAAALDTLSRLDLPALAALPPSDLRILPPSALPAGDTIVWQESVLAAVVPFGDTFPPGAAQRTRWLDAGRAVIFQPARTPAASVGRAPRSPLVQGHVLLAAARRLADQHDRPRALVALRAALRLARGQQERPDLGRVRLGARLERDALDMIARDSGLAGEAQGERARKSLARLEAALEDLRTVSRLIEAAGAGPAGAPMLARWAADSALPVALRDELIRAVGYGWIFNPLEVTYGLGAARRTALDSLSRAHLPDELLSTLQSIQAMGSPSLTRRMALSVEYRIERD